MSSLLLCIGFSLGFLRYNLELDRNNPIHFEHNLNLDNEFVGKIDSEIKKNNRWSATIEVRQMNSVPCNGKMLIYFHPDDKELEYEFGDLLFIKGRVHRLKENSNPYAFNYKDYLKYKGVAFQVFLRKGDHYLWSNREPDQLKGWAIAVRNKALSIFNKTLKNKDHIAVASAMVLGYREELSDQLYSAFSETGAVHILAVSGLHVGIICMIFLFIFSRIRCENLYFKVLKLIVLLSVVWFYAMLTGASPAVLRASVMFSLLLIGKLWFRGANIYNILVFSALLILLYDPFLLFQLSFQLSYLALISIVFFQPKIERLYETRNPVMTKIWQLTTVAIAAQILVFPISIYYFNTFPTYFILSGVAAVFLASFILAMGLILIFVESLFQASWIVSDLYTLLLDFFLRLIKGIQSLPYNQIAGVYISKSSLVILYLALLTLMFLVSLKPQSYKDVLFKKVKRRRLAKVLIFGCISLLMVNHLSFSFRKLKNTELVIYDVNKHTLIDVFSEGKLYSLSSKSLPPQKKEFVSSSLRIFNGSTSEISLTAQSMYRFKEKDLLILNDETNHNFIPCHSDIMIVTNAAILTPEETLEHHETKLVILDSSLNYKVRNQWRKYCDEKGVLFHDVREEGAFRLS